MPASANIATPITVYRVVDTQGAQASVRRFPEKAGQKVGSATYLMIGVPVHLNGGYVEVSDTIDGTDDKFLGFSLEGGHNLASDGVAGSGAMVDQGSPPNQSSAKIIPGGAWPTDGTMGVALGGTINEFVGTLGNSSDGTLAITAQTQRGSVYGLTKDATNNFWYVDQNITTAAGGACVEIVDFVDAIGTLNGRVVFKVLTAILQIPAVAS